MSIVTPESIPTVIGGHVRTITYEMAMRRLFNRAIEIALTDRLRNDIDQVRAALIEVEKLLLSHYQDARRKEIRDSTQGAAQRKALQSFAESQKRFLPPLWVRALEKARTDIMLQFIDYHMVATLIDVQENSLESWHAAWPTVVVPELITLAARDQIVGLDDPNHYDLVTAESIFHTRAAPQLGNVVYAGPPRRSLDRPETVIEFRLLEPRSFFTVDLMDDAVDFHPEAVWTQGMWDLWATNLEPSVHFA